MKNRSRATYHLVRALAVVVATAVAAVACSGDDSVGRPSKPSTAPDKPEWAIHIYVGPPSSAKRMDLGPVKEISLPESGARSGGLDELPATPSDLWNGPPGLAPEDTKSSAPGSKPQATVGGPDGGVTFEQDLSNAQKPSGWALVWGAAVQCGLAGRPGIGGGTHPLIGLEAANVPPWKPNASGGYKWNIFDDAPQSCSHLIAYSEALLCTANELAEVAEAVSPITWDKIVSTPFPGFPSGPWTIPPQSNKDRFIARDLAIYMLANLALNDMWEPTNPGTDAAACSNALASAAKDPTTYGANNAMRLFGVGINGATKYFPPELSVTTANIPKLADSRLRFNTQILRNASRLLKELIEDSVEADLAGTEQRRARATDPDRGNKTAWGQTDPAGGAYNTLAHAVRILAGRWELGLDANAGPYFGFKFWSADPACGSVSRMNLLSEAYGPDLSARVADKAVTTAGQRAAMEIVSGSGIVIPRKQIELQGIDGARSAILDQLIGAAATAHGISPTDQTFNDAGEGAAIKYVMADISNADLTFALDRSYGQYQVLAAQPEDLLDVSTPGAGLKTSAFQASTLTQGGMKGISLKDGLPRQDLAIDVMSRAGGMLEASQCDEYLWVFGQLYAGQWAYASSFQDSFSIAQALGRRLVVLREASNGMPASAGEVSVHDHAEEAAGEVRAWSGPGRLAATSIPDAAGGISEIWILTFGLEPDNLAVSTPANMEDQIVLVHGQPWVADCAAGLRTNCPPDFEQKYVVSKTSSFVDNGPNLPPDWKSSTGSDGTFGWFVFPGTNGQNFTPSYIGTSKPDEHDRLYVVARHDPLSPAAKGRVLGSAALRVPYGGTGMPISDMQRKLLNDILGISTKWRDQHARIGVGSTSNSPSYCIKGVPKDLFVPLENELTSDSDQYENSWKHYVTLARQAAQKADELGQKLIDIGLQQDFRREASGEELANTCGDFGAMDDVQVSQGDVTAPSDDKALQDCLNEDKYDVVFLTNDVANLQADPEKFIKDKLGCPAVPDPSNEVCNKTFAQITHAGLNLATYIDPSAQGPSACPNTDALANSLGSTLAAEQAKPEVNGGWATAEKMSYLASRLRVQVSPDLGGSSPGPGHWELQLSGVPLMSSAQGSLWPGCRRQGSTCAGALDDLYDSLFRRIPQGFSKVLGYGQDGGGDADREAAMILWRVQGAAWMIGALAGSIPDSMFVTQIPTANFAADWGSETKRAPAFTIFANGMFNGTKLDPTTVAPADSDALGPTTDITGFAWPSALVGPSEIPEWLRGLYTPPPGTKYRHAQAANPELTGFGTTNLGSWLDQQLTRISGMVCSDLSGASKFQGNPGKWPPNAIDAATAVASMRKGKKWGQTCQNKAGVTTLGLKSELTPEKTSVLESVFRDVYAFDYQCPSSAGGDVFALQCIQAASQRPKSDIPLFPLGSPDNDIYPINNYALEGAPQGPDSTTGCNHPHPGGIHAVNAACANDAFGGALYDNARYTKRMLLPRACSAGSRVQLFVNSYPPPGVCGAAAELVQALALACHYNSSGLAAQLSGPPQIKKLADLDGFVLWIDAQERKAKEQVGQLYLERVPKKVVDDYASLKVGTGANKGEHGTLLLELRKSLETMAGAWNRATGDLGQLRTAVDTASIAIVGSQIDEQTAVAQLALQRMQIHANMIEAATGFLDLNLAQATGAAINAGAQIGIGLEMLGKTDELEKLADNKQANQVAGALNQLQLVSNPVYTDLQNAIGDIRSATATAFSISNQLALSESKAKYEAAKGTGADFVEIDGEIVKFPVNTVQNRLYDITRLRYLKTLAEAKYLAYVARLAIEQRIGVRLTTISTPVGPLDPPSVWADDVCSLTGIDYQRLRNFNVGDGGADAGALAEHEKEIVAEFADQYVGDYVDKLEGFVEYYNIAYPSHDGDDTAVLSLRDDLLGPASACLKEAPNLLYYSSDLTLSDFVTDDSGNALLRGWVSNPCEPFDVKCMRVEPAASLPTPPPLPEVATVGGLSWLHDEPPPTPGLGSPDGGVAPPVPVLPPRTVSQEVELIAGSTYILSWWDQARATDGTYLSSSQTGVDYRAQVLAPDGSQVAAFSGKPFNPGSAAADPQWSERHAIDFKADQSGKYRVLFGASFDGTVHGSVVVANVQLEQGAPGALPSGYINTGSSRQYLSSECTGGTAEDVQKAFKHACDANKQCYYELVAPVVIDTNGLATGKSRLNGKLAAGNFNFRHITLSANLVGTGVYDCTANPSQSCFGSAFIEYTVNHDAFQSGIIGYDGDVQYFNFGSAGINHAKALAAEKYITLPISSADGNLLGQPGIEKPELRGRPLDGSYRIRIWDSPYLVWNRLEDVQLILKYRYWSRIQPQPAP